MLGRPIDLSACDTEPIHEIGAVQPHGALLGVDAATSEITYASDNLAQFIGVEAVAALGQPLASILGTANVAALFGRTLEPRPPDIIRPWFPVEGPFPSLRRIECFAHAHDGQVILEIVPREEGPAQLWEEDNIRQRIISDLIRPATLEDLAQVSADILREVTGFDRVMIYRFAEDRHGEVIAESTLRADSFLGLHYPASDIPDPARRHFLLNVIRSIPDINAQPSPILTRGGMIADASHPRPLDLTFSKLRAVAPVHVEYLNNMGVGASMSVSLIANDRLWGLVACHHYGPLHLPWSRFRFCELLGGTVSALLQNIENATQLRQGLAAERMAHRLERSVMSGNSFADAVGEAAPEIMQAFDAAGLDLHLGDLRRRFGRTPGDSAAHILMDDTSDDGLAVRDDLGLAPDMLDETGARLGGAAMLALSDDAADRIVLFRDEFAESIRWAGKPEKIERRHADGTVRLSPRGSFALWSEERRGRSKPFSESDREALRILRRGLFALNSLERERAAIEAQKQAEREEARLRLAVMDAARRSSLGELAAALAHELTQPLAAVSNYVNACRQELGNFGVTLTGRVPLLLDNAVAEAARAADLVRRLRNFIEDGALAPERIALDGPVRRAADLALAGWQGADARVAIDLPPGLPAVLADPVQLEQVILNLVRNGLQAMDRVADDRTVTISARRAGRHVEVSVADRGPGIAKHRRLRIFEPFHASTTSGLGLGLSLCRSILEAHGGRIWVADESGGARFVFTLPIAEDKA